MPIRKQIQYERIVDQDESDMTVFERHVDVYGTTKGCNLLDLVREKYPSVYAVVNSPDFDTELRRFDGIPSVDELFVVLDQSPTRCKSLIKLFANEIGTLYFDPVVTEVESNLSTICSALGVDKARTAYRTKLLEGSDDQIEDVRYELAVAARACAVLDSGSIELEKPIPDSSKKSREWKNTDIFGTFDGIPVRIEVTAIHEELPAPIPFDFQVLAESADISSGFHIVLRHALDTERRALLVRTIIEQLHERHLKNKQDEVLDGIAYEWVKGAYHCKQADSLVKSACFYLASDFPALVSVREVICPCLAKPITSKHIMDDHEIPHGVMNVGDSAEWQSGEPVSTKIFQMLERKLRQCEQGAVNIVAFSNPLPMHDREVQRAVFGSEFALVSFTEDDFGVRRMGATQAARDVKSPFSNAELLDGEQVEQFIVPFRVLSAVWHIRLGTHRVNNVLTNPNATMPIPLRLANRLEEMTRQ